MSSSSLVHHHHPILFKLHILSISLDDAFPALIRQASKLPKKNVFLDISSDGQINRRFHVGRFNIPKRKTLYSITHLSKTPVTLQLTNGPSRQEHLGRHTLFFSPHDAERGYRDGFLPFGKGPAFKLEYILYPVQCVYGFTLNEIVCVSQISSKVKKDNVYAQVEHGPSPHLLSVASNNTYSLGTFGSNDVRGVGLHGTCSFTMLTNCRITLYAKGYFSDHVLGTLRLYPIDESINHSIHHESEEKDVVSEGSADGFEKLKEYREEALNIGGMVVQFEDGSEAHSDAQWLMLIDAKKGDVDSKSITLSSTEGGAYVMVFSLTKEYITSNDISFNVSPSASISHMVNYTSQRDSFFQRVSPQWSERHIGERTDSSHEKIVVSQTIHDDDDDDDDDDDATLGASNQLGFDEMTSDLFGATTIGNTLNILVDGLETFETLYEVLMAAQHSISIIAWELSLSFGLIHASRSKVPLPSLFHRKGTGVEWVSLEDVLLSKAKEGVCVRIVVWRHALLSFFNRFMYLGEFSIEREVAKMEKRCEREGIRCKVFHTIQGNMPDEYSVFSDGYGPSDSAAIQVIIVGNPQGILSSHHEKLWLIDPECEPHSVAFTGGMDVARGRYDQPLHQPPRPLADKLLEQLTQAAKFSPQRFTGPEVQPLLSRIRILWHDVQMMIRGPATQALHLHFLQRWRHNFVPNAEKTRKISFPLQSYTKQLKSCPKHSHCPTLNTTSPTHPNCTITLSRCWNGVYPGHYLFDDFCRIIEGAENYIYFEHQYPFQNFALTYYMCQTLRSKPHLRVLIVTPVKTDLPKGIVGEWIDWSQEHITKHLEMIYNTAPDRVGVYGLVQYDKYRRRIKPIYVHTKLCIVDDQRMLLSTANMDNMSFFYSSELSAIVEDSKAARTTRSRLLKEHLGDQWKTTMEHNFNECFDTFRDLSDRNRRELDEHGILLGRPVALMPRDVYESLLDQVYYPNKVTKMLYKLGLDTEDLWVRMRNRLWGSEKSASPYTDAMVEEGALGVVGSAGGGGVGGGSDWKSRM